MSDFIGTREVARRWNVTQRTVRNWIERGHLPASRRWDNGRMQWRIDPAHVAGSRPDQRRSDQLNQLVRLLNDKGVIEQIITGRDRFQILDILREILTRLEEGQDAKDAVRLTLNPGEHQPRRKKPKKATIIQDNPFY